MKYFRGSALILTLILIATALPAQTPSEYEGVGITEMPDTTTSVIRVDNTIIVGLSPMGSAFLPHAEYLYTNVQECIGVEKPYEGLTLYTSLVMYEIQRPRDDGDFVALPQLLGLYYHDPSEIVVVITDQSPNTFAATLTHEYIHYLEPAWQEAHVESANAACWEGDAP